MKIFKLAIGLTKNGNNGELNIMDKEKDVIKAKNRFNADANNEKYLLIIDIMEESIIILLRINNQDSVRKKQEKKVKEFLDLLMKQYKWNEYKNKKTKKFFRIDILKQLEIDEYLESVKRPDNKIKKFNTSSDLKKFTSISKEANPSDDLKEMEQFRKKLSKGSMSTTLRDALNKIDILIGYSDFKKEIKRVVKFIDVNNRLNESNPKNPTPVFPFHYLFLGKHGVNHFKAAVLMAQVFFQLGIIAKKGNERIDVQRQADNYAGLNLDGLFNKSNTGMVFIENVTEPPENTDYILVLEKLIQKMQEYRGKILFILSSYENRKNRRNFEMLRDELVKNINFRIINFPFYSDEELVNMINMSAESKQYSIEREAAALVAFNIKNTLDEDTVDLDYIIEKMIERAIVEKKFRILSNPKLNKSFDLNEFAVLGLEDFNFLELDEISHQKHDNPSRELEEMIGLEYVKERVKQISDFIKVKIKKTELGFKEKQICLHMEFTGNPGTGKTTVARILGRIFKKLGCLSKGSFLEVTRENLIGPYIGQTLPKVKGVIEKALGGILFIDEAYSLNSNADNDFGLEAISYIVKCMEEYKDDLIIIFAGYPEEMDKMIALNPGMHDRIAFKIEFPDYNENELIAIFNKMCDDNHYVLTEEARNEISDFISRVHQNKRKHFGNARLIRRIFERVEIFQNRRLCRTEAFTKEEIQKIIIEDIKNLYEDREIGELLKAERLKGNIGFIF